MPTTIYKVEAYHVEIPDRPGEGLRILLGFKEAGVNLLACCGSPAGKGKTRLDLVPQHEESFLRAATRMGLSLSERERAFLVQEGDHVGSVAETLAKLAGRNVNVVAACAVAAGGGRYGMLLRVDPAEHERAAEALGF